MPNSIHFAPAAIPLSPAVAVGLQGASTLALLYFSFSSLLEDPSTTLLHTLPILSGLQSIYLLTIPRIPVTKKGKAPSKASVIQTSINTLILSYALAIVLGTLSLMVLTILLGAPFTTHQPQTLLFSAHVAVLAVYPLVYELGVDGEKWKRIFEARSVGNGREFWGGAAALVGAWVAAVVIPLDWDRVWQRWPVPILVGAYLGSSIGRGIGLTGVAAVKGKTE